MEGPIKERDWKYLRLIHDEMLHALCSRINKKAIDIVGAEASNPHERYLKLYQHIQKSDRIIADCFNDWRRSNITVKITCLCRHRLLQDEHVQNFSESAQAWLSRVEKPESL